MIEDISKRWVFMPLGLTGVILGLLIALLLIWYAVGGAYDWKAFADLASLQFVIGIVLIPAFYLRMRKSIPVFQTMQVLGIPVGLLGGVVGAAGFTVGEVEASRVAPAAAVMLLTSLYGAIFSAIGYFAARNKLEVVKKINLTDLVVCLTAVGVLIFLPMTTGPGLSAYASLPVVCAIIAFILIAIILNQDPSKRIVHCVSDGALAGVLISLIVALVIWFQTSPEVDSRALSFGILGILYGTVIYIFCYFVSLMTGEVSSINFTVKNWHLVEANSFFIFLVFAPVSLPENLYNKIDDAERIEMLAEQKSMRSQISVLTQRLAKLEGS